MPRGKLFLIPTIIAENTQDKTIAPEVKEVIAYTSYYLVENIRTARRYISSLKLGLTIEDLNFETLDKNVDSSRIHILFKPLLEGHDIGIISESGCPGVADPGSLAVAYAHANDIQVVPLAGPSSILMALMASGFNGQSFVFHGYVPIEKQQLIKKLKSMETDALRGQTQLFMDTPYRNMKLLEQILATCQASTQLSVAKGITSSDEQILTKSIAEWKAAKIDLHKVPTIFSLGGN